MHIILPASVHAHFRFVLSFTFNLFSFSYFLSFVLIKLAIYVLTTSVSSVRSRNDDQYEISYKISINYLKRKKKIKYADKRTMQMNDGDKLINIDSVTGSSTGRAFSSSGVNHRFQD